MKKIVLLFILLLRLMPAYSQSAPVLDTSWLPQIGDYYEEYETQLFYYNHFYHQNYSGNGVIWDFSDMRMKSTPSNHFLYVTPGYCHGHGQANLVEYIGNQYSDTSELIWTCFLKDTNGLSQMDYISNTTDSTFGPSHLREYYSKPFTLFPVPFSLGDTIKDTTYLHSSDAYTNATYYDTGWMYNKISYEGYGTLKLPAKVYDSVVKIHFQSIIWDTASTHLGHQNYYTYINEYDWYYKANRNFIFRTGTRNWITPDHQDTMVIISNMLIRTNSYYNNSPQLSPPVNNEIQANYNAEKIHIKNLNEHSAYQWQITNTEGRVLQNGQISHTKKTNINPAFSASGLYLLHITDKKTHLSSTLKIFKP